MTMIAAPLGNATPFGKPIGTKKGVEDTHSDYTKYLPLWTLVHDAVEGEYAIKAKGTTYLPNPDTSKDADSAEGKKVYASYLNRAKYYNVTGRTLEGLVGHVFSKQPIVSLTPRLQNIENNIDGVGTSLEQLAKLNLARVLSYGRAGLLVDYPKRTAEDGSVQDVTVADLDAGLVRPKIVSYSPFSIRNWGTMEVGAAALLRFVVLKETFEPSDDSDPQGFGQDAQDQYRVLRLNKTDNATLTATYEIWRPNAGGNAFEMVEGPFPLMKADQKPFDFIPFKFVVWQDNTPSCNSVPLYDIASLNIGHYRNSAEFEDSVFLLGNPQLVLAGVTKDWVKDVWKDKGLKFGSRTAIALPTGASASLEQAEPNTLAQTAMEQKERQMVALGATLVENKAVQRTATEANQDETTKVSVLSSSADNVSEAITDCLVWAGLFIGEEQSEVKDEASGKTTKAISYVLNTDFDIATMTSQDREQLRKDYEAKLISFSELRAGLKAAGVAFQDDEKARDEIEQDPNFAGMGGDNIDPITGQPLPPKTNTPPNQNQK